MNHTNFFHASIQRLHRICTAWMLPFCWILGLLLGVAYGCRTDRSYILLMRIAAPSRVSFVGLLFVLYIPLLLAAFAVYYKQQQWLLPICFLKAFLFASCGSALFTVYHSATWLVRLLLQFSDFSFMPFLYWFCMKNMAGRNGNLLSDFLVCCIAGAIIGIFDFGIISPYLVKLIHI